MIYGNLKIILNDINSLNKDLISDKQLEIINNIKNHCFELNYNIEDDIIYINFISKEIDEIKSFLNNNEIKYWDLIINQEDKGKRNNNQESKTNNKIDKAKVIKTDSVNKTKQINIKRIDLSTTEYNQLGTVKLQANNQLSTQPYPTKEQWPKIRNLLVQNSLKSNPNLDLELTAYTPGETLDLLEHPKIIKWHNKMSKVKINNYELIIFVPCAKTKPWVGNNIKKSKLYSSYNQLKINYSNICFVTISEPLGVVPMEYWNDFPQYDNPGLFKDNAQRSSMTTKQWLNSEFNQCYSLPFDDKAYNQSIKELSKVINTFMINNKDKKFISFVDDKNSLSTHADMLNNLDNNIKINRHLKRIQPRISPYNYLEETILKELS